MLRRTHIHLSDRPSCTINRHDLLWLEFILAEIEGRETSSPVRWMDAPDDGLVKDPPQRLDLFPCQSFHDQIHIQFHLVLALAIIISGDFPPVGNESPAHSSHDWIASMKQDPLCPGPSETSMAASASSLQQLPLSPILGAIDPLPFRPAQFRGVKKFPPDHCLQLRIFRNQRSPSPAHGTVLASVVAVRRNQNKVTEGTAMERETQRLRESPVHR